MPTTRDFNTTTLTDTLTMQIAITPTPNRSLTGASNTHDGRRRCPFHKPTFPVTPKPPRPEARGAGKTDGRIISSNPSQTGNKSRPGLRSGAVEGSSSRAASRKRGQAAIRQPPRLPPSPVTPDAGPFLLKNDKFPTPE